ncbi:Nucleolysin TIAR, partial [Caligus rogercresseyi]
KEMKVNWASSPGGATASDPLINTPGTGNKQDTSAHHHIFVGDLSPDITSESLRNASSPLGTSQTAKSSKTCSHTSPRATDSYLSSQRETPATPSNK